MPGDQWSDQQDPEQRIAELERQAEAATRAAGYQPLTNAPGPPPPWPNAPGPYEFSPMGAPWSSAPTKAPSSSAWMIISLVVVAVVILPAIGFAVFYLTQHNRGGHGGGPSPSAAGPSTSASGPSRSTAVTSPSASVTTPNQPTSTKRLSDDNAYKAYGEVPIPGNKTLHLPAGQLAIYFHVQTASGGFGRLTIPDLKFNLDPPAGVADPEVTESIGGTTTIIDNESRRRVWIAQIPQDGDYRISTDGKVGAFIWARLAFGQLEDE
jgi:hypothetical protein